LSKTPKDTFDIATLKGRIPIGVVAGIAWLESRWDPSAQTGRHVGLFQLVDSSERSLYGDWLQSGGPKVPSLSDPAANAAIAGWALERTADQIRKALRKYRVELPNTVFWPLVYWAWLAGTSDVPAVVRAYADWLSQSRGDSLNPLRRLYQEAQLRISAEGQLWRHTTALAVPQRWAPDTLRRVLATGAIAPTLSREFVYSEPKAAHAARLTPWVTRGWSEIVRAVGPEFERLYKRPISAPWPLVRALGAGALLGALLFAYLLLRR
jgi:hypothetical protein